MERTIGIITTLLLGILSAILNLRILLGNIVNILFILLVISILIAIIGFIAKKDKLICFAMPKAIILVYLWAIIVVPYYIRQLIEIIF